MFSLLVFALAQRVGRASDKYSKEILGLGPAARMFNMGLPEQSQSRPATTKEVRGMCRVCCTRFARSCVRLIGCRNWAVGSIMLSGLLFLGSADAQASRLKRLQKQPPPKTIVLSTTDGVVSEPRPTPAPRTAPPLVTIEVEQSPAQPPVTQAPVVSWDGKQLTIDAENTSLSEILLAIRSRTGASIEMPPSTSSERVAVHMGPAPVREVLSSLLYGTDFNYVIQSSDGDEEGLGKVIITAREKDGSEDASASNTPAGRGVRLMPGYAAPGKRDFEVKHDTDNDASAQSETSNAAAGDVASVSENPQSASKVDAQPVPSTAGESADTSVPASDAGVGSMGLAQPGATAAIASSSNGGSGDGSSISKMEQDLQRLYQQRKQMQAQQNHSQPQGPGN